MHTALGSTHQRLGHQSAMAGEIKNVGFKLDAVLRRIHGAHQCRKQLDSALKQRNLVPIVQRQSVLLHAARPPCSAQNTASVSDTKLGNQRQVV